MDGREPITALKGVGEKTGVLFKKLEIHRIDDLLHYYPRNYDAYEPPVKIHQVKEGEVCAVEGMLMRGADVKVVKNLQVITVDLHDETGRISMVWFNMPFLRTTLRKGMRFIFRGKAIYKAGRLTLQQPEIFTLYEYDQKEGSLQPIYGLTKGLTNKAIMKAVKLSLENRPIDKDYMPEAIRRENQLAEYNFALDHIHFPTNKRELLFSRARLVFDEFFFFLMMVRKLKEKQAHQQNNFVIEEDTRVDDFINSLPYELTKAQQLTLDEIMADLTGNRTMHRLVQGDVGSGKTIVALIAILQVVFCGYQGAIMAPTEVLAKQHLESVEELLAGQNLSLRVALLTGSMTAKEKRLCYEKIKNHEVDIVIGTHALIQEKVEFAALALAVIDEQHRFGVKQREALSEKGLNPHILVMSATPIPRTLAIIIYGDLDISVIDELPKNRLPIKNCVIPQEDRKKAFRFIETEVGKGRQAYVICPMVEESEMMEGENVVDYTKLLRQSLNPAIIVDYLHGKMKAKEKNEKMEAFARGEINILVSTTVIEVGVNVPNSTVMMVENAERFGLAQLHQLRGRVGRGGYQSYCIFISGSDTKETKQRLEILVKSNDGFFVSSEDLKLRGPGDVLGLRQSGLMEFQLGDIYADSDTLKVASEAVNKLLKEDEYLELPEHQELKKQLLLYEERGMNHMNL